MCHFISFETILNYRITFNKSDVLSKEYTQIDQRKSSTPTNHAISNIIFILNTYKIHETFIEHKRNEILQHKRIYEMYK